MPNVGQIQLIAYADRWSVAPGESVRVMVSTSADEYRADLVRLRHGDPRPQGPGRKEYLVEGVLDQQLAGREQGARAGSCVTVPPHPHLLGLSALTVQLWVWSTAPGAREQGLVSTLSPSQEAGWGLLLDDRGHVAWRLVGAGGPHTLTSPAPLRRREWYFVCASYDAATDTARLEHAPARPLPNDPTAAAQTATPDLGSLTGPRGGLLIAALTPRDARDPRSYAAGHFDGKLGNPRLFNRQLSTEQIDRLRDDEDPALVAGESLLAAWDLGRGPDGDHIVDTTANGMHGQTVNLPTRAVTGHNWTGRVLNHREAPQQYGAIHFHADDLEDAAWEPDFEMRIPESLPSGVYAVRLRAGDVADRIPLFVRPPRGRATAPLAVLLPTLTYLAYGNERVQFAVDYAKAGIIGHDVSPGPRDLWLRAHPELGLSTYDRHADDSGCCYASRLRPIPNMRPDYRNWLTAATRHLAADLYLIDWLEHHHIAYDIITDEDLHEEGKPLLQHYTVLITGSHPEYYTERMLLALDEWVWRDGGRLMYLGGNGFYWVTSMHPHKPHVMEVRRGHSATRGWESQPGETFHATTGEPGGLWRHRGRPPNKLVGVGFSSQGWDKHSPGYTRTPASHDAAHSWMFDGVPDVVIGDFGLVMGGAAGDEIDRHDLSLGSPPHATVVATSQGRHSEHYQMTIEDVPVLHPGLDGPNDDRVRADLTYLTTPGGGAVFSAASVSWTGSLSYNDYNNSISSITMNVVRRLLSAVRDAHDAAPGGPHYGSTDAP